MNTWFLVLPTCHWLHWFSCDYPLLCWSVFYYPVHCSLESSSWPWPCSSLVGSSRSSQFPPMLSLHLPVTGTCLWVGLLADPHRSCTTYSPSDSKNKKMEFDQSESYHMLGWKSQKLTVPSLWQSCHINNNNYNNDIVIIFIIVIVIIKLLLLLLHSRTYVQFYLEQRRKPWDHAQYWCLCSLVKFTIWCCHTTISCLVWVDPKPSKTWPNNNNKQ